MQFATDIVLDIVCYRRHGHNESDEPAFTQPIMYRAIDATKTTRTLYAEQLAAEGVVTAAESAGDVGRVRTDAGSGLRRRASLQAEQGRLAGRPLVRPVTARHGSRERTRTRPRSRAETLTQVGAALARVPAGFDVQPEDPAASSRPSRR